MVEEKVYYRYVGEHSQSQGHLGESRVGMTFIIFKYTYGYVFVFWVCAHECRDLGRPEEVIIYHREL